MSSEAPPAGPLVLSPRAGVALLTLQLRAAQQEAAAAEAEDAGWDLEASVAHLRSRLVPRVEDRRHALDQELVRERAVAAEAVARARADAAAIVAEAHADMAERERHAALEREARAAEAAVTDELTVGEVTLEAQAPTGEVPAEPPTVDESSVEPDVPAEPQPGDATVETLARLTALRTLVDELMRATATGPPLPNVVTAPPESASIKVVIDADSFSKAFSSAITSMMDERLAMHRAQQEAWMTTPWRVVPAPSAPPPKKSFWANAWHADVLLSVIAMIIVLVVLVAWST